MHDYPEAGSLQRATAGGQHEELGQGQQVLGQQALLTPYNYTTAVISQLNRTAFTW